MVAKNEGGVGDSMRDPCGDGNVLSLSLSVSVSLS